MLSPRELFASAVLRVVDEHHGLAPYFGVVLRGLVRRESTVIPTLAVSKYGVLLWNPEWVGKQTVEVLAFGLCHETMHVLLKHFDRAEALGIKLEPGQRPSRDLRRKAVMVNYAEDACINEELRKLAAQVTSGGKAAPVTLPEDWIYPDTLKQPDGLIMEDRYRRLLDQVQQAQQDEEGEGEGEGKGDGEGEGEGEGKGVGQGACGSCTGRPLPGEPAGAGDGRSEAEMARYRRETAEAVREHATRKGRGTVPGGLLIWADEMLTPPKVDWRTQLARIVRAAIAYRPGAVDLCYTRPSRRQAGLGFGVGVPVVPAFRAPIPQVAVVLDTSGSMSLDDLRAGCAELSGVLQAVGAAVTFCVCDADVHGVREVDSISTAIGMLKGGGGTSMTPAFEALAVHRPTPEVVIVLTDGLIGDGYPAIEPAFPTVWVVVGGHNERPCPWGEVVFVDESGAREAA